MVLVSVFDHAVGEFAPCMCVNSEAADKTQGLPHVAAATAAEIAAAAIAPFVQKCLASLTRSRDACEAELKIVSDVPGFEPRVKYLKSRIQDLNNQIFPLVNRSSYG